MIRYVDGDAFTADNSALWDAIGHQVNASGGFGAGFARAVARYAPEAEAAYRRVHRAGAWELGRILPVWIPNRERYIVHICAQAHYGGRGRKTDYDALARGLAKFASWCSERSLRPALPRIGAGLGGGDWERIVPLVEDAFGEREVIIFRGP